MPEICVAWKWKSTSPLHVGSGLSQSGVADSLVQRERRDRTGDVDDHDGNPIIPGEAVKGALRMAAEQVAAWLGEPQDYGKTGNAEPKSWPLARLFVGEGARCTAATLVTMSESQGNGSGSNRPPLDERPHVFTSTAIDRTTGRARDDTLRKTEFVPSDLLFAAQYNASVADGETEVVETLLMAALAAVESVGGKTGIGWGRMELAKVTVAVNGVGGEPERDPADAVTPERLNELKSALSSETPPHGSAARSGASAAPVRPLTSESIETGPAPASRQWFKLTIELQEPTCLPSLPEFSNQLTTQDCIAATTLRGALASYWRRSGHREAGVRSWLSDTTVWTPALRSIDGAPVVPASRSFVTTKRAHGREPPVHDTFGPRAPTMSDGSPLQWRSLAGGAIRCGDSKRDVVVARPATRETRMHVARDYRTGSKRTGALYARESLTPGTRFVAWARVPRTAFEGVVESAESGSAAGVEEREEPFELLIGKRLSAGNGRATVQVERADAGPQFFAASGADAEAGVQPEQAPAAGSCAVFVQLLSPAVIYDPDGYPRRTLDLRWWKDLVGVGVGGQSANEIEILTVTSRTAPGRRGGWMRAWRHARAAATTVDAGSVWRLCCRTSGSAGRLRKQLRGLGQIGERTHEGFGWIAVDPPWLGRPGVEKLDAAEPAPPKPEGEALPWPGATIGPSDLADIARNLANERVSEESARAYQEIAARVRTAPEEPRRAREHLEELKTLCAERADRSKSKWKPVNKLLSKYKGAEPENKREHYKMLWERLRFELGILITRGTAARR